MIRLMANGSLHTCIIGRIRVNFLGFDRLSGLLKIGVSKLDSRGCRWWRSCCHGSLYSYFIQARESFASCESVVQPANKLSLQELN